MQIIVTAKKPILTAEKGRLPSGIPVEVSDALGTFLIGRGEAQLVETKGVVQPQEQPAKRGRKPKVDA